MELAPPTSFKPVATTLLAVLLAAPAVAQVPPPAGVLAPFPVTVRVDARAEVGEMRPIWRFFGYDEPNFTTMKDGLASPFTSFSYDFKGINFVAMRDTFWDTVAKRKAKESLSRAEEYFE